MLLTKKSRVLKIIPYKTERPENVPEFSTKMQRGCISVSQTEINFCPPGRVIFSEGFSKCWALILRERKSGQMAFAHVQQILNFKQYSFLKKFGMNVKDPEKEAIIIEGSLSNVNPHYLNELSYNFHIIKVDTGKYHWDASYRSGENIILINSCVKKRVFVYSGFDKTRSAYQQQYYEKRSA